MFNPLCILMIIDLHRYGFITINLMVCCPMSTKQRHYFVMILWFGYEPAKDHLRHVSFIQGL